MLVVLKFIDGIGFVFFGNLFFFLFIIIVCGVVFGFYVFVLLGMTLKMIE